jgi:RNA polymerase sigma factor (sigma-70 family)
MASGANSGTGSVLLLLLNDPANPWCWEGFVERYGPKIYGWCRQRGLQEADAQDVTQEVLTQLVQKLKTFRYDPHKGSFRAWLKTLTHHAWCDYLESRRAERVGDDDPKVAERLEILEAREDLLQALAETFDLEVLAEAQVRVQLRVSPRDWKIFEQLAVEGRTGPVVARELGMTVTAVLMAKSRVQQKLRKEIRSLQETTPRTLEAQR